MTPPDSFSYDKAITRIEAIVSQLEENDKSIDELAALVKEASSLVKACKKKLRATEDDIAKAFDSED
ncbi:exodeoxyribonuclease VII small subunit [Lunatibacter salilacus]|uniref:exodeoxyribonuclease VII small subunit n=1 Tax=Lunatibacter salilacus TaxID=2483804 RepID=UPI00131EA3A9|nr:exodeoxyribonuclease VII small subunit [Lunatibacter salilacus]